VTSRADGATIERKVVVCFDMCSSSMMLEDLRETDRLDCLRKLLISVKSYLHRACENDEFIIYKFIGDGWILLFPRGVDGSYLMSFLTGLSEHFKARLAKLILPELLTQPHIIGLTVGIDEGRLIRFTKTRRVEYIGRALNVASRLQSAIKDRDHRPAYKLLLSKHAYRELKLKQAGYVGKEVTRKLRNIYGGHRRTYVKLKLHV
jgi:class 3 adenylate cyclase